MKKLILLFTAISMVGCSSSGDSGSTSTPPGLSSFSYDGSTFQIPSGVKMSEAVMTDVAIYNGSHYSRSTISITGLHGSTTTATLSFDLFYKVGTSVAGTYTIYDSEAAGSTDFESFLVGKTRGMIGWTSSGLIYTISGGTAISGNNPLGTVKVVANSATNYTLTYSGNFRLYDSNFTVIRNMPAVINVTSDVTVQH